jgi:hypothetical protein
VPAGWKPHETSIGVTAVVPRVEGELVRIALTPATTELMFWTISFEKP